MIRKGHRLGFPRFVFDELLSLQGRLGRRRFLANVLKVTLLTAFFSGGAMEWFGEGSGVTTAFVLTLLAPVLVLVVRRLHDFDMRAAWVVLLGLVVVPFGALIVLVPILWPGNRGGNRFGPTPERPTAGGSDDEKDGYFLCFLMAYVLPITMIFILAIAPAAGAYG